MTSLPHRPYTVSNFSRYARLSAVSTSFTAVRRRAGLSNTILRVALPILPKPLIAILNIRNLQCANARCLYGQSQQVTIQRSKPFLRVNDFHELASWTANDQNRIASSLQTCSATEPSTGRSRSRTNH